MTRVAILGVGKLGEALLSGLLRAGRSPADVVVTARRRDRAEALTDRHGVRAVANQAFLTATATAGVSERLSAWADVSLIVFPRPDSWGEPEGEGD